MNLITSREIAEKFDLTKGKLDNLISRNKKKWDLKRDERGNYIWDSASIEKLAEHLHRSAKKPEPVIPLADSVTALAQGMIQLHHEIQEIKILLKNQTASAFEHRSILEHKIMASLETRESKLDLAIRSLDARVDRRKTPSSWVEKAWKLLNTPLTVERRKRIA